MKSAERDGPQEITLHGRPAAVVLSASDYMRLRGDAGGSLVEFMRKSPLHDAEDVVFERDRSPVRKRVAL